METNDRMQTTPPTQVGKKHVIQACSCKNDIQMKCEIQGSLMNKQRNAFQNEQGCKCRRQGNWTPVAIVQMCERGTLRW